MNVVIVGQGAIGGLWAAKLANNSNVNLSVLPTSSEEAHSSLYSKVNKSNAKLAFSFTHYNGSSEEISVRRAQQADLNSADVILLCLKAFHISDTIKRILPELSTSAVIILCHNGMGTTNEISQLVPEGMPVLTMLITHGAARPQKKHVIHTGTGSADIGIVQGTLCQERSQQITRILDIALPSVKWQDNIIEKQWLKLAINIVINPLTAINNIKNGAILSTEFAPTVSQLCNEVSSVAQCEGINLSQQDLLLIVKQVATDTAKNTSSMLNDILNQQATEIDYITGYLIKVATKYGVPVAKNLALFEQVKQIECKALP